MKISVVGWDADRVMYDGLSTSICAEKSQLDPKPYLDGFIKESWFDRDDTKRWAEYRGKDINDPVQTVGDLADMFKQLVI